MHGSIIKPVLAGFGILALLCLVVGWWTLDYERTRSMDTKVTADLNAAVRAMMAAVPRTEVHDAGAQPDTFFVPDVLYLSSPDAVATPSLAPYLIYNQQFRGARLLLYQHLLFALSQDPTTPLFKVTGINISTDYASIINVSMTYEFLEFGWITKSNSTMIAISIPQYRAATGPEQFPATVG